MLAPVFGIIPLLIYEILAGVLAGAVGLSLVSSSGLKPVAKKAIPSVGIVLADRSAGPSSGTIFVVDKATAVTAYHTVAGASQLRVKFQKSPWLQPTVLAVDPGSDLAVLGIGDSTVPPLPPGDVSSVRPGDHVLTFSFPSAAAAAKRSQNPDKEAQAMLVQEGTVKAIHDGVLLFQPHKPLETDGGPVLNDKGQVIGIARAGLPGSAPGIASALPADAIKPVLTEAQRRETALSEPPGPPPGPSSPQPSGTPPPAQAPPQPQIPPPAPQSQPQTPPPREPQVPAPAQPQGLPQSSQQPPPQTPPAPSQNPPPQQHLQAPSGPPPSFQVINPVSPPAQSQSAPQQPSQPQPAPRQPSQSESAPQQPARSQGPPSGSPSPQSAAPPQKPPAQTQPQAPAQAPKPAAPQPQRPAPAPAKPATAGGFQVVPGNRIGAARLGMRVADIQAVLGPPAATNRQNDGTVELHWYKPPKNDGIGVRVTKAGTIDRIWAVNDPRFVTDKSLHVGSTEADVRAALGPPSNVIVDDANKNKILYYKSLGLWFFIQLDSRLLYYNQVYEIGVLGR
jgi:hypothetical protein